MPRAWADMEAFEAFLNAGGIVEADDAMPDEYRNAVFRFIELHANKPNDLLLRRHIKSEPNLKQTFGNAGPDSTRRINGCFGR